MRDRTRADGPDGAPGECLPAPDEQPVPDPPSSDLPATEQRVEDCRSLSKERTERGSTRSRPG